ncbi:MAG: FAD:protein FMN transferase [Rhodothalassiaceae bacterium]|nr:MAG: FAD:protein FMN transferase [Rhodothalassiaceae bacterium]
MEPERTSASWSRRRVLQVIAAAPAFAALPARARGADAAPVLWRGRLMGAEASLAIYAPPAARASAEEALAEAVALARRLEALFSLYRADSALVLLNETGRLRAPPPDFAALLAHAALMHRLTDGFFNPLVGVLFDLYLAHFADRPLDEAGPPRSALEAVRPLLCWSALRHDDRAVTLAAGAKLSFNGIAQGYATDRVAELLGRRGFRPVLVNFGEYRALGGHPRGTPFTVGLADPRAPGAVIGTLPVSPALAASSPFAAVFDEEGRFHHLLDPRTARPAADAPAGIWVAAGDATTADALSTGLAVAPPTRRHGILARFPGAKAWILGADGRLLPLSG